MTIEIETPVSEAALYDMLHQKFGIGDWYEGSKDPWWKARNTEIAKLRATMRKRRLTIWDMAVAAWHAERVGRPISAVYHLCNIVGEAKRAYNVANRAPQADLRVALEKAAAEAMERGQPDWADKLYRTDLASAPTVLDQWAEWVKGW